MSVEDLAEKEPISIGGVTDSTKPKIKNYIIWVQGIVFLLALSLLFYVLSKIGFQTIAEALGKVGWGFLIIIALNGSRHMLRALSIYLAIPPQHDSFKYR